MACVDAATAKASTTTKSLIAVASLQNFGRNLRMGTTCFKGT
jgi:hypothetical protein